MGYISDGATIWKEHCSTADKLTGLDKLEGMYGEACTYIDAITHSGSYYTEAQADAKYFTAANDGTGSGLICATLDGYSAQEIINAGSPSGVIGIWSGSVVAIPSGWYLCNGLNGTPDLRNRFVPGAGSHYTKGETGGAGTVTTSATITVAGHALTAAETPLHSHGTITDYYTVTGGSAYKIPEGSSDSPPYVYSALQENASYTGYAGSGTAHSHTASFAGTASQVKMPEYYAACFIMRA